MKKYSQAIINLAFGLMLLAIMTGPISRYLARAQLVEENSQMDRERKLQTTLESTLRLVDDAETGERGFLLTHDPAYLAPYADAVDRVHSQIHQLQQVAQGDPDDNAQVVLLASLMEQKFGMLNEAIDSARSRPASPFDPSLSRQSKATMDRIRELVGKLSGKAKSDLDRREAKLGVDLAQTARMFLIVTLFSFLTLLSSYLLVHRAITEQRRAEADMLAAKARAESASNAKTAFLTNMSHEIRTPMTAIVGFSEMLLQPNQTLSDRHDALQVIRRNSRHLLELINDVLDLSRIEAGKMVLSRSACDLINTLGEVASMMRSRAVEKGLGFRVQFQGPIPRKIHTDPLRLRQVLVNLLGNAIKFTESGEVRLVVSCPPDETNSNRLGKLVQFEIIDTGIGMTPEQMARLFHPFTQADESTTRKFGGSGLGLDICKRLAKMLGGDVSVRSIPAMGSTFTLSIDGSPLEDVEIISDATALLLGTSRESADSSEIKLTGHVLLAEDGPDNQRLIRYLLERAGARVTLAENGRIAVNKARAEKFDLILMDMQMPELDGYGATSELRRRGVQLPVIALTAHAMSDDRDKCMQAGCTDYLTKPLDTELLLKTVRKHLPQSPQSQPAPVAQASSALPARTGPIQSRFARDARMTHVIDQFVTALPERVAEIRSLLDTDNRTGLVAAVHRLKGAGGGFGFSPISECAARAESKLKDGSNPEETRRAVEELVNLIRTVEGYDKTRETAVPHRASAA